MNFPNHSMESSCHPGFITNLSMGLTQDSGFCEYMDFRKYLVKRIFAAHNSFIFFG